MNEATKNRAKAYRTKVFWKVPELSESNKFRETLRFETESDLDFGVMDYFYGKMLSQILSDARERSERYGFGEGYAWGKRYLTHYVGDECLVSKSEHPALHTKAAYDLLTDKLEAVCSAGDDDFQRVELVRKCEDAVKTQAKKRQAEYYGNQHESGLREILPEVQNVGKHSTDELGEMAGVSGKTYEHATKV